MFKRAATLFWMSVFALCFSGIAAQTASAHHVNVTATASCDAKNNAVITYTASSWDPGQVDGTNPEIDIFFNGVKVDQGAFTLANGSFTNTLPAPGGNTSVTVTAQAIDPWGDGFPADATPELPGVTVQIPQACVTGRFTGGGKELDLANGVAVTQGLELDCDLNPSFNLEVNWAGNSFHLENFTSAICSLVNNPAPPNAPINTMIGVGTGRYNGVAGYNINFTLVDNGEPGVKNDQIAITIFQTGFPPVLSFGLTDIIGGNLQAHPDQR